VSRLLSYGLSPVGKNTTTLSNILEKKVPSEDDDPNFERKLDVVMTGSSQYFKEHLLTKITRKNCKIIVDYVFGDTD
jgi:hypothetical protein